MSTERETTRRGFIKGVLLASGVLSVHYILGIFRKSRGEAKELKLSSTATSSKANTRSSQSNFKFFSPHQGATVALIASLIIPTDKDPGANEAGVVYYIDNLVGSDGEKREEYTKGIEWIDDFSQRKFGTGNSFIKLKPKEQLDILTQMEKRLQVLDEFSVAPKDKVKLIAFRMRRKLNTYLLKLSDAPDVDLAEFFRTMKYDVFDGFYSHPISWPMLSYQGPPQYSGYPDYGQCGNEA